MSLCPRCKSSGFEILNNWYATEYHCVICGFYACKPQASEDSVKRQLGMLKEKEND